MSALGLNQGPLLNNVPTKEGKEGDTTVTQAKKLDGTTVLQHWKHTNGKWEKISSTEYRKSNGSSYSGYKVLSLPGQSSVTGSLRYPQDAAMAYDTDYVLFEFYEYKPPFQGINKGQTNKSSDGLGAYNQSVTDESFYEKTSQQSVVLYMPEDVSTGYRANWSGKAFSNIGRDALITAGSGDLGEGLQNAATALGTGMGQAIPNLGNKVIRETISKITGEQLSQNDIFSSTRGVILNPNVELLFGGTDLRNFQLNYKLVPRNGTESGIIKQIVNTFRKAMLPRFANGDELTFSGAENIQNNFIKVPNVCRVSFMRGGDLNTDVAQYKMCAITQVDINYTPDGTYATYGDGSMVAIQLSLNFQETKLIFAEEVEKY